MILRCPNCGEQYDVQANKELIGFSMACANCGNTITTNDEIKVTVIHNDSTNITPTKKRKSLWKWVAAIIVIVLVIMVFTKPEKTKHVEKVREMAMGVVNERVSYDGDEMSKGLAMLFGPFVINQFLEMGLQVNDYVLFNVGRIKFGKIEKPITIGVLNCVITLVDSDDLAENVRDDYTE